jgi:hypothetical protein
MVITQSRVRMVHFIVSGCEKGSDWARLGENAAEGVKKGPIDEKRVRKGSFLGFGQKTSISVKKRPFSVKKGPFWVKKGLFR